MAIMRNTVKRQQCNRNCRMSRRRRVNIVAPAIAIATSMALTGCGALPAPVRDFAADSPRPHVSVPEHPVDNGTSSEKPILTIDLPPETLKPTTLSGHLTISSMGGMKAKRHHVFSSVPLELALRAVLDGTRIGLVVGDDKAADKTVSLDMTGAANVVVDRLCRAASVYCFVSDGAVEVRSTETFTVTLPPAIELQKGIRETVAHILAAGDSKNAQAVLDETGNRITYTATQDQARRIVEYFKRIQDPALLIYETWISEITLSVNSDRGVNFNKLSAQLGPFTTVNFSGGHSVSDASAVGFGSIYSGKNINLDIIAKFLSDQGAVKTLASPQIDLLSGTSAEFKDGGKIPYVYQVGILTSGNQSAASGTSGSQSPSNSQSGYYSGSLANNTVQTKELETGLKLKVDGLWQNGLIETGFKLDTVDLVQWNNIESGGISMKLPQTVDRTLQSRFAIRPGDVLIIGGIRTARTSTTTSGIPLGSSGVPTIPTGELIDNNNKELVVLIRPRVIVYHIPTAGDRS